MKINSLLFLGSLLILRCIAVENSIAPVFSGLPECAIPCLEDAVAVSSCNATDTLCVCTDSIILESAGLCATQECSVKDLLVTKNATLTNCGAPIRDKTPIFVNTTIVLGTFTGVFVLLRFATKFFIMQMDWGLDDLFVLITFICGLPSTAMNIHGTAGHGEGKDIWTLRPDQITTFGLFFYVLEIFYFAQVSLLKMSLLFFYLRIFYRSAKNVLLCTILFNAAFAVMFIFVAIFQCSPVSFFWEGWDGEHEGKCLNTNAIGWANASISIALDLWMLAIPLWCLQSLKMHWKKKIAIAAMFMVGTFITVVSIVRLQYIVTLRSSHNPTFDQIDLSIWSTVEINVGIMCVCMPTLRVLIGHFFPSLRGSTNDSNRYIKPEGRNISNPRTGIRNVAIGYPSPTRDANQRISYGITVDKSFGIQHSDADDIYLVELRPTDAMSRPNRPSTTSERSLFERS